MRARCLPIRIKPEEWLSDLTGCSLAAQGLWLRLMFVAHDAEPYGRLAANGQPIPPEGLARRCGCSLEEFQRLLAELEAAGVLGRAEDGTLYCRGMVRDGEKRAAATRRQKAHREKKQRSRHAAVTPLSQPPAEPSDTSSSVEPGKQEEGPKLGSPRQLLEHDQLSHRVSVEQRPKQQWPQSTSRVRYDLFDKFWQAYPRKLGRGAAMRAFALLSVGEIPAVIAAAENLTWGSYIPLAANWLLDRRWEEIRGGVPVIGDTL